MPDHAKPSSLRNLGPVLDEWLRQIGVETVGELRALGSLEAWQRLRFALGPRVTLIALHALEGALTDEDWRRLPPERKAALTLAAKAYLASRAEPRKRHRG